MIFDFAGTLAISGICQHEKAVWNPEKAHAAERCGESDLCNRRRARGRTDFPTGLPSVRLQKAGGTALDFINGGQCYPGRLSEAQTGNRI